MLWVAGFLILFVALMVPILAIVLDSPAVRNFLESRHGAKPGRIDELGSRVELLQDQLDDLTRSVEALKEETRFLQRLLENPETRGAKRLSPPNS